jgi:hypothetical protein
MSGGPSGGRRTTRHFLPDRKGRWPPRDIGSREGPDRARRATCASDSAADRASGRRYPCEASGHGPRRDHVRIGQKWRAVRRPRVLVRVSSASRARSWAVSPRPAAKPIAQPFLVLTPARPFAPHVFRTVTQESNPSPHDGFDPTYRITGKALGADRWAQESQSIGVICWEMISQVPSRLVTTHRRCNTSSRRSTDAGHVAHVATAMERRLAGRRLAPNRAASVPLHRPRCRRRPRVGHPSRGVRHPHSPCLPPALARGPRLPGNIASRCEGAARARMRTQ